METKRKAKGSRGVRFFIAVLGITLGILFFWLLSFVEGDIGKIKGLKWEDIRREFVSESTDEEKESLTEEVSDLNQKIRNQTEQMNFISRSTSSHQNTISQLLTLQRDSLRKNEVFSDENRQILLQSQAIFVENQGKYQSYNNEIAELTQQLREKEKQLTKLNKEVAEQEVEARKKYDFKNAVFKLGFLIPVFLFVSYLFMKYRAGAYWPLVWSTFIASFIKTALVVHEYFSKPYFKYVALAVVIAIVLRLLVYLIKLIVAPKKDLLIKQYQQFYDKHVCPICTKPIKAGPLRYAGWKKKTTVIAPQGTEIDKQSAYTCPSCGTNLYDKCEKCGNIRHTLLPYCEHCGSEKSE